MPTLTIRSSTRDAARGLWTESAVSATFTSRTSGTWPRPMMTLSIANPSTTLSIMMYSRASAFKVLWGARSRGSWTPLNVATTFSANVR